MMIVTLLLAARRMRTDEACTPAIVDKQFDIAAMVIKRGLERSDEFREMEDRAYDRAYEAREARRAKSNGG